MRVLVLGVGGQVGRALVATAPQDVTLTGFGRRDCDLADSLSIEAAIERAGAELVINAAAATGVDAAETEPEVAHRINGWAPGVIARAVNRMGGRLVHLSTDFVFDGTASTPRAPLDAVNPINVYGRAKLQGERAVAENAPESLIVRTAWVYSEAGRNFVRTMLRLMSEKEEVSVVADQIGTPTFAISLASALWKLAAIRASGIHHFTDAGVCSWYDFAVAIEEEASLLGLLPRACAVTPIASSDYPVPARRPACVILDKRTTWEMLGEPAPHWRANLRRCLRAIRNAP